MNNTLIVFARAPILRKVKKRLAKQIGHKNALEVYIELLEHTISISKKVKANLKFYWDQSANNSQDKIQEGDDLGERMYNSLSAEFKYSSKVCLIGTDTPGITSNIIDDVYAALETNDIVFGPANDGGYYLIATSVKPPIELFINKLWSHEDVLKEAISVCEKLNLKVFLAPTLVDIDTIEDLKEWKQLQNRSK